MKESADSFYNAYNEEHGLMEVLIDLLNAKLHPIVAEPAQGGAMAKRKPKEWKENRMFKPQETLNKDTSPADIDSWVESMEQYAASSYIFRASTATQQAFMRTCVDETFWNTVKDNISGIAPLFPKNKEDRKGQSVVEILRRAHAVHNPIAANRLTLFTKHQTAGQAFEEYQADMLWVYNRCDISTLTDLKLLTYLVFMGIRDDDLKEAILDEVKEDDSKITSDLMLEVCKTRTTINIFKNMVTQKDSHQVNFISPGKSNDGDKGKKGKIYRPNLSSLKDLNGNDKKQAMQKLELCFSCGFKSKDCKSKTKCPAKEVACKLCEKKGHYALVCLNKQKNVAGKVFPTPKKSDEAAPDSEGSADSD